MDMVLLATFIKSDLAGLSSGWKNGMSCGNNSSNKL